MKDIFHFGECFHEKLDRNTCGTLRQNVPKHRELSWGSPAGHRGSFFFAGHVLWCVRACSRVCLFVIAREVNEREVRRLLDLLAELAEFR